MSRRSPNRAWPSLVLLAVLALPAAADDVGVTSARLIELADGRDAAIKDYLVGKHGVKPGRLVACQPAIDPDEGAGPRVDLLI